jgi:hypothetical protein
MLEEDARFMNEDAEGLNQATHWKRPITIDKLQELFWNEIGCGVIKISGCNDEQQKLVDIVRSWINSDHGKKFIDFQKSNNL